MRVTRIPGAFPHPRTLFLPENSGSGRSFALDVLPHDLVWLPFLADALHAQAVLHSSYHLARVNCGCALTSSTHRWRVVCLSCCCSWLPDLPMPVLGQPASRSLASDHLPFEPLHLRLREIQPGFLLLSVTGKVPFPNSLSLG